MQTASVSSLTKEITIEILKAFSLPTGEFWQETVGSWFEKPAQRFSEIFATFDQNIAAYGIIEACKRLLTVFVEDVKLYGLENIPREGPLLITGNHPGTFDGLTIAANLPRSDIKVIVGGIPFLTKLPAAQPYLIYALRDATRERANAVRNSIRHLENGGALMIFPSGQIDPDPAVLPGAREALEKWSKSIALMIKKVPETNLMTAITSGVLAEKFAKTPWTFLRKDGVGKRRIMEFLQVMRQLVWREKLNIIPNVTFAPPMSFKEFNNQWDGESVMHMIVDRAKDLMNHHMTLIMKDVEDKVIS